MASQHGSPRVLLNTVSEEHVDAIAKLWQKSTAMSPLRIKNYRAVLDEYNNKLYTLDAIQHVLDSLNAKSAQGDLRPIIAQLATLQLWDYNHPSLLLQICDRREADP